MSVLMSKDIRSAHAATMNQNQKPSALALKISTSTLSGSTRQSSTDSSSRFVGKSRNASELVACAAMSGSVSKVPSNALLRNTRCFWMMNGKCLPSQTEVYRHALEEGAFDSKRSMAKNAVLSSSSTEVVQIVSQLIKDSSGKMANWFDLCQAMIAGFIIHEEPIRNSVADLEKPGDFKELWVGTEKVTLLIFSFVLLCGHHAEKSLTSLVATHASDGEHSGLRSIALTLRVVQRLRLFFHN